MGGGEEECQKRTNNGFVLPLSPSYAQSAVRSHGAFSLARSFVRLLARARSLHLFLTLLPFIVLVCQAHRTTVQTERGEKKEEEVEEEERSERTGVCVYVYVHECVEHHSNLEHSMRAAKKEEGEEEEEEEEEAAALTVCIT